MEFDGVPANGDQIQQFGFGAQRPMEQSLEMSGQFGAALAGARGPAEPPNDPTQSSAATLATEEFAKNETGPQPQTQAEPGGRAGAGRFRGPYASILHTVKLMVSATFTKRFR